MEIFGNGLWLWEKVVNDLFPSLLTPEVFLLIFLGILIGIFAVVIGGGMFFSVPLLQILFPEASFGVIVGNLKVGSWFRGLASTWATRKNIDWKNNLIISVPLLLGTVLGVSIISQLDQKWILPAIIFAVILAEVAPKIADKISQKTFYFASVLIGIYAGFLGAGIGVLLLALFRIKFPKDKDIARVKIQARFVEWVLVFVAVGMHAYHQNLVLKIWLAWSIGSLFGGFIGGKILHKIGHLSGKTQKMVLRTSFAFAIFVAFLRFLG